MNRKFRQHCIRNHRHIVGFPLFEGSLDAVAASKFVHPWRTVTCTGNPAALTITGLTQACYSVEAKGKRKVERAVSQSSAIWEHILKCWLPSKISELPNPAIHIKEHRSRYSDPNGNIIDETHPHRDLAVFTNPDLPPNVLFLIADDGTVGQVIVRNDT